MAKVMRQLSKTNVVIFGLCNVSDGSYTIHLAANISNEKKTKL